MRKFAFIDALRGLAILGVILSHATHHVGGIPEAARRLLQGGDNGVKLFFMASALTLFLSMDSRRREARPLRNFFLRRFFRIAPLFFAGIAFYLAWTRGVPIEPTAARPVTPASLLATLSFTNGWSPSWINQVVPGGWSIAVEMNFYLCVPLLYATLRSLSRAAWAAFVAQCAAWAASWGVIRLLVASGRYPAGMPEAFASWWLPAQAPVFLMGIVAYFLTRDGLRGLPRSEACSFPLDRRNAALVLIAAAYGYLAFCTHEPTTYVPVVPLLLLMLVVALARCPFGLLVNPASRHLGKVSFSAYLCHFAVLEACAAGLNSGATPLSRMPWAARYGVLLAATLALTAAVATATYHLIEVPGQEAGRRLIRWLERRTPADSAVATAAAP